MLMSTTLRGFLPGDLGMRSEAPHATATAATARAMSASRGCPRGGNRPSHRIIRLGAPGDRAGTCWPTTCFRLDLRDPKFSPFVAGYRRPVHGTAKPAHPSSSRSRLPSGTLGGWPLFLAGVGWLLATTCLRLMEQTSPKRQKASRRFEKSAAREYHQPPTQLKRQRPNQSTDLVVTRSSIAARRGSPPRPGPRTRTAKCCSARELRHTPERWCRTA